MPTSRYFEALDTYRRHAEAIGKQYAAVNTKAIAEMFGAVNALSSILPSYRQTAIATQLVAIAAPVLAVPESPSLDEFATTAPSVNWVLLGQFTLRVIFAAIALAVIVALWEEQSESAPAEPLLESWLR
jgi:tetrahydromethanopterin S-methyltransferase subunit E